MIIHIDPAQHRTFYKFEGKGMTAMTCYIKILYTEKSNNTYKGAIKICRNDQLSRNSWSIIYIFISKKHSNASTPLSKVKWPPHNILTSQSLKSKPMTFSSWVHNFKKIILRAKKFDSCIQQKLGQKPKIFTAHTQNFYTW